jgi:membrane protein
VSPKDILELLKETFSEWSKDKASRLAAALAYYTIFSVGPLLLVIIAMVGLVFGEEAARGQIAGVLDRVVGRDSAELIQEIVKNAAKPGASIIATVIGVATLLLGAAGIFGQLQDALNTIWDVPPRERGGILDMLKQRLPAFIMVLGVGLLLLASLLVNSTLAVLGDFLSNNLPGGSLLWQIVNFGISLGIMTLLFAMIYKVLPDTHVAWGDVWIGAAITALLFTLGQIALGFYLGIADVGSAYGAAGSLVSVLVWIYYSAQIFLFGAEFTQVYARMRGSRRERPVAERERAVEQRLQSPWFA